MKRLALALMAASVSTPAFAQHAGHAMPADPAPAAERAQETDAADPHAGHVMAPPSAPADPHAGHVMPPASSPVDPHAGHNTPPAPPPAAPAPMTDPHAGHVMPSAPPAAQDPHAGHSMPPAQPAPASDPHAGHDMGAMTAQPAPPKAPPSAAALAGPAHAADGFFGAGEMAAAREIVRKEHGAIRTYKVLVDRAEAKLRDGRDGYAWDAEAWYGGDIHKLRIKSEGEGLFEGGVEKAEVQALWSRAIDPWFDIQAGARHDFSPDPEWTHLVLGVQGLAPYWFEVDGAFFLSDKGDVTARLEGEYDLRLTQKLIAQPRAELDLSMQDIPEIGIGAGLSLGELGVRLRYEIRPEFAPYVGVEYERLFGGTADLARARGDDAGGWSLLAGVRTWF